MRRLSVLLAARLAGRHSAVWLIAIGGVALAIGCGRGPSWTHVRGAVTMDGRPADQGYVTFRCIDPDRPPLTVSYPIAHGSYDTRSAKQPLRPARYEVRVAVTKGTGRRIPLPAAAPGAMQDEIIVVSGASYNGPDSPLRYDCSDGHSAGTFDIDVPAAQ